MPKFTARFEDRYQGTAPGLGLAEGDIDKDADGDLEADGDFEAEPEILGLTLADSEILGLTLADRLIEGDGEIEGETL